MGKRVRAAETAEERRTRDAMIEHTSTVGELLERRADIAGVVPMADLIRDAVTWAA